VEQVGWIAPFRWQGSLLEDLANAGYALARYAAPSSGGHIWQAWAHRLMLAIGARRVQGPGSWRLFGFDAVSGLKHEFDAAGIRDVALVIEAKDQAHPLQKGQLDEFDGKTFDYFAGAALHGHTHPLYRMIWSTREPDPILRRYAALKGMIMVTPDRVPLPSLLAAAERWDASDWFPEQLLSELVLLGERACVPLTSKPIRHVLVYECALTRWRIKDLDDLEYIHYNASEQWLDSLDIRAPFYYQQVADYSLRLISGLAEVRASGCGARKRN
jgi:hypothetical protein